MNLPARFCPCGNRLSVVDGFYCLSCQEHPAGPQQAVCYVCGTAPVVLRGDRCPPCQAEYQLRQRDAAAGETGLSVASARARKRKAQTRVRGAAGGRERITR